MGAIISQPRHSKELNMTDEHTTVCLGDKNLKTNNNGSEERLGEITPQKYANGTANTDLQSARAIVEEPRKSDGGYSEHKSVHVVNYKGDSSNLKSYFNQRYPSHVKQVKQCGWHDFIVEFKSRQVAEDVIKVPHTVGENILELKLTFNSENAKTEESNITKDQAKQQDVPTTLDTKKEGKLYPYTQMHAVAQETQENDHHISSQSLRQPELQRQETASRKAEAVVLPGIQSYNSNEEDESCNDARLDELPNNLTKADELDANGHKIIESADEMKIELDAVKIEFIKKVYSKEVDDICYKNNVVIAQEMEPQTHGVIFRAKSPGKGNVDRACDQFVELYHKISAKLSRKNTINVLEELPDCTIRGLSNALSCASADGRILVKNCLSDDFKVVFYGSEDDVANAMETFVTISSKQENHQGREEETWPQLDVDVCAPTSSNTHFDGTVGDITISVYEGDITKQKVDVVVNAANERLEHAGGVALAISRAGGKKIQEESRKYVKSHGKLPIGQAMHTTAGDMPCKYVVHTVGLLNLKGVT